VRYALRSTPPAHKQKLIAKRKLAPAASASASAQILIAPAAVPRYAAARASQANRTTEGDVSMSWRSRIWTVFFLGLYQHVHIDLFWKCEGEDRIVLEVF